jgi:hypothetical protein
MRGFVIPNLFRDLLDAGKTNLVQFHSIYSTTKSCSFEDVFLLRQSSSREASLLQQDSTRLFPILLRMYRNAFAALGTQPADVPFAIAGDWLMWIEGMSAQGERDPELVSGSPGCWEDELSSMSCNLSDYQIM